MTHLEGPFMFDVISMLASSRSALTAGQVAEILQVSPQTIYRAATRGVLPSFAELAGSLRFNPGSVASYLRSLGAAEVTL